MGKNIKLTSEDGHRFNAYVSQSTGVPKGAVVIIQEIFGINDHMQAVCDQYADLGYTAIAPALFDRISSNIKLEYDAAGVKEGLSYKNQIDDILALKDINAANAYVASSGKVSVIGYCWGGTLAYLAACQLEGLSKAVGYYGGGIAKLVQQQPQIPTLLHFGDTDASIPLEDVNSITQNRPELEVHVYEAGHGFNCNVRASHDQIAADLALKRTLKFIAGA